MPDLVIIDRKTAQELLSAEMCLSAVEAAMRALTSGAASAPLRQIMPVEDGESQLLLMPAAAASEAVFGFKALSIRPSNSSVGRPAIQGFITLFDQSTGAPVALIDGETVTAMRTAAASAVASRALARGNATAHGILGTGVQAESHARMVLQACPQIEIIVIWGRSRERADSLVSTLSGTIDCNIISGTLTDALSCGIVSAVTSAKEPFISRSLVSDGAHLNLVGSHSPARREADSDTIAAGRIYVDCKSAALKEAGDLIIPICERALRPSDIIGEIGDVLRGKISGRQSDDELTIFKSLGNGVQDLYVAAALREHAAVQGKGHRIAI